MDDVVPAKEIIETVRAELPLEPIPPAYPGEVANRWRYRDGGGEVGVIASVTQPFCGDCSRLRLSARGELFTCLFAAEGHDVRTLLREGADDHDVERFIASLWSARQDRYSELRSVVKTEMPKVEMSYIGG
jgi:cyclic pyranopterin phosphate synthase